MSMGGTSNRGCWERSDVEMAETIEEDRNSWHRDRLNVRDVNNNKGCTYNTELTNKRLN